MKIKSTDVNAVNIPPEGKFLVEIMRARIGVACDKGFDRVLKEVSTLAPNLSGGLIILGDAEGRVASLATPIEDSEVLKKYLKGALDLIERAEKNQ